MAAEEFPEKSGRASVSRRRAPPQTILLPALKLDLGVVLLFLVCLWLGVGLLELSSAQDIMVLLTGSAAASLWLAWRTRRVLLLWQAGQDRGNADEP